MKTFILTTLLGALGVAVLTAPALAATSVSFTPVTVSVRQGQAFTLTIGVNPQEVKNYTAKMELRYPADLLEVKSFIFANGWSPLTQSGYDLTDNANGTLIKTAGYPGGVSSATSFGTVSFLAKKSGNGTISLHSNSFALDANNQNVLSGTPTVSFNVTAPVIVPVPTEAAPTTQLIAQSPTISPLLEPEVAGAVTSQPAEQPTVPQDLLLANVGAILTLGTGSTLLGILVGLIILAGIGYATNSLIRRK